MRTTLHIILGVLLWVVFIYYWHLVMKQPVTDETKRALMIVGAIVATITVFDFFWVLYNVRLGRRTRRRTRPAEIPAPSFDFLGRNFVAQNDAELRSARYIEVHVIQMEDDQSAAGHKLFRVTGEVPEA
jgi:multisubunit Na+/H+ antiporter MnhE subunit